MNQDLTEEEWRRVAIYGFCPCGGARDIKQTEVEPGHRHLELWCPKCGRSFD